jgi:cytochrome c551/c552
MGNRDRPGKRPSHRKGGAMTEIRVSLSPQGITVFPRSAFAFKKSMVLWIFDCHDPRVKKVRISFKDMAAPYFRDSKKDPRLYYEFTADIDHEVTIWGRAPNIAPGRGTDGYAVYGLDGNCGNVIHLDPEIITDDPPPP